LLAPSCGRAGEDLLEELAETIEDVVEVVEEDLGDAIEDALEGSESANETAAERAEEAAEAAEEVAEEAEEREVEEEEAEVEDAEEEGLLIGAAIRTRYYAFARRFAQRAAMRNYYLPSRMATTVQVPGRYAEHSEASPPYYYGAGAVPKGMPLQVASMDHYAERRPADLEYSTSQRCSKHAAQHSGTAQLGCITNVSTLVPPVNFDRYELVPAAALLTPEQLWRWPLQLRMVEVRVYTNRSDAGAAHAELPLLLGFDAAGWDPQTAFNSEDEVEEARERGGLPTMLPAISFVVMLAGFSTVLCGARCGCCCSRPRSSSYSSPSAALVKNSVRESGGDSGLDAHHGAHSLV
jgi:hypothetical protein